MGLFSAIGDAVGSIFGGGGGGGIGEALIGAAGSIGGALIGSSANEKAARQFSEGSQEARDAANARLGEIRAFAEPGIRYQQGLVTSDPGQLFPDQQQALDDLRQNLPRQLAGAGLRGSGRATVAAIRRVESDFMNDALSRNRQRRDSAASQLTGDYTSAATGQARNDINIGTQIADANANATTASGGLRGSALADIGSLIADQGRRSRYDSGGIDDLLDAARGVGSFRP